MIAQMARRRKYEMKKRAVAQEATRRRIVEAAVELHEQLGPAQTSVSAIAERAGVQRHTYYRHFPDERSLAMACSGSIPSASPRPTPSRGRRSTTRWSDWPPAWMSCTATTRPTNACSRA